MTPVFGEPDPLDFRAIFEAAPSPNLIVRADPPQFTIVAANDAYLAATMTTREAIVGRAIFEAFPDNPNDPDATGVRKVRESIEHVVAHRQPHTMAVQRYDVPRPDGRGYEERYWSPIHTPVFGPGGEVAYVIQRPEDVTEFVRLKDRAGEQDRRAEELRGRAERMEAEVFRRAQELAEANADLRRQVEERKRAEAALAREQDFLRAVLDHAADGIVACDADGVLRFFNGAARAFHGVAEQPLPPARWAERYDLYLPDGRTRMTKEQVPLFRALAEGSVKDAEMIIAASGQPPRLLTANGRAITDADGRKLGAVVVMHDLTARKVGEEQRERAVREEAGRKGAEASAERLRESEERYRQLVEMAYEGIWTIDAAGRTTYVNRRMAELLGYAPEEMMGRVHTDFMWEQDRPKGDVDMERRRQGTAAVWDQRYRRKDGTELWTVASCGTLYDGDGAPAGALGMFTDITDRKRAEAERQALLDSERAAKEEAERAGRMKDEFLATLSHELRTPLNAILGWSQILANGGRGAEDLAEGLRTIERNARAQTRIIEDLLDMSRIISGKVRLDVQRVDLTSVVRGAVETSRPAADAKHIRLQAVLDPAAGAVHGDPNRLQQVMWNLLANAIKFTPKAGRVQVLLERVNSHVEVRVIDSGEGIAAEFLPHVFDRFRQADASTTRRHGGLGLGLAIVRQLVELHGGDVRVRSPGVGQGTTFTVSLPVTVIHADPEPQPRRRHPVAPDGWRTVPTDACLSLAGVNVLVVDDEPDARTLLRRVLEDCDAVVRTAASASDALGLFRAQPPDVLVSDIGMPVEDGYDLIRRIRALEPELGGGVPAVALTANARSEDRMRSARAGFQVHIPKPVEPAELITMVASLAGRKA